MLANPIYCRDLHYGRRSRNPARGKRQDEPYFLIHDEPSVVWGDAVPAIISREEWNAAQATRAARQGVGKGTSGRAFSSSHLLTGMAQERFARQIRQDHERALEQAREGESLRERVKVLESLVRETLATIGTQAEESELAEQVQDVRCAVAVGGGRSGRRAA